MKIYPSWSICKGSYHVSISHPPGPIKSNEITGISSTDTVKQDKEVSEGKKKKSYLDSTQPSTASEALYLETNLSSKLLNLEFWRSTCNAPNCDTCPVILLGVGTTPTGPGADS